MCAAPISEVVKTLFAKACWEVYSRPLDWFVDQAATNGWSATEIYLKDRPEPMAEIRRLHREANLSLIAQIITAGDTPEQHLTSLHERYHHALVSEPLFINCHTGRDLFSFDDNRRLFEAAVELSLRAGVPLLHETHRGRALFTAPLCLAYLRAVPGLRLTADFSHLFCVHESNLADQTEAVDAIIAAADHIHGRVGFSEGPQLANPRNPAYREWVDLSIGLWTRIRQRMAAEGRAFMTLTPEFGSPLYAPLRGLSDQPESDPWQSNHWMRDVILRCPMIPGINDQEEHLAAIAQFETRYPSIQAIEILPWHTMGNSKYAKLGRPAAPQLPAEYVPEFTKDSYRDFFAQKGCRKVSIC